MKMVRVTIKIMTAFFNISPKDAFIFPPQSLIFKYFETRKRTCQSAVKYIAL